MAVYHNLHKKYVTAKIMFSMLFQKCFLSSKSAHDNDFWRSCDTEDWSNDAENIALITEINYIILYIHIENSHFKLQ